MFEGYYTFKLLSIEKKLIVFLIIYKKLQFCLFYILKELKWPTKDNILRFVMDNAHFLFLILPTFLPYLIPQIKKQHSYLYIIQNPIYLSQ